MKVKDKQRLVRAERMMVRHMRVITLKDKKSCEELRQRLGSIKRVMPYLAPPPLPTLPSPIPSSPHS